MSNPVSPLKECALNAVGETFFAFTANGDMLEWNRRLSEVTGYSDEELAEMHPTQLVPPREADLIRRHTEKTFEQGSTRVRAHYRTKEGQEIPYEFTGSLLEWNGKKLVCGTGRPIAKSSPAKEDRDIRQEQQARRNALLQVLKDVADAANEAERFEEALRDTVEAVCERTSWRLGHVYVPSEEEAGRLESMSLWKGGGAARFESFREVTEETTFGDGEGLIGDVLATREPVWIEDVTTSANFRRRQVAEDVGLKGAFTVPVPREDGVAAVLEFFSEEAEALDEELLEAMTSVGVQLGQVAKREEVIRSLKASVKQYKSLKESAPDGIVIADSAGTVTDWNRGATEIFGYEKEEIVGQPIGRLMPEPHKEVFQRGIERVNRTGEGRYLGETIEMEGIQRDGEEFPMELSLSSWTVNGTRRFAAIIRDITERRRWENELRQSEERYRRLFEDSQEGIAITTPEGEILDANSAALEIFGYSREVRSMNTTDLYVDPEERKLAIAELQEKGALEGREFRLYRADGEEIICRVSVTVHRTEEGRPAAFQTFFRDVTEQKRAKEALRESEETFRKLAEGALVGIGLLQGGTYEYVNPALADITGYAREELLGTSPEVFVHPEDWEKVRERLKERVEGETEDVRYETRIRTKGGETRLVEVAGTYTPYRRERAVIGTIQDITEQRRLQREILQVQEEERKRLGQDLHDGIASQLTGATIMLSTLSSKVDDEEVADSIEEVQELIQESASDVRRLSRGLNPRGLAEGDLFSALEGLARNTEIARFEGDTVDGKQIDGEVATHLYRIAQESVANARRHGKAEEVVIRFRQEEKTLLLEVEDDGEGFAADEIDEEGLGFRSMRHRAELLDAELTTASTPGEGTLIRCRVPVRRGQHSR